MSQIPAIIKKNEAALLADWLDEQQKLTALKKDLLKEADRREQSRRLLDATASALASGNTSDIRSAEWRPALDILGDISRTRATAGYSTSETATFVFSLKQPLFNLLQAELKKDPAALADELWTATALIDKLGLYTTEVFQKTREDIIQRSQQEMLELSTPVVRLFRGLIALPLIGTLDSARTQVVMENLLQNIVASEATIAILDITGVPTVDTQVAQHLLKTVAAARLMGADCIISGVRPQIAQTIVHLGVDLQNVTTKATMADALKIALHRLGYTLTRDAAHGA